MTGWLNTLPRIYTISTSHVYFILQTHADQQLSTNRTSRCSHGSLVSITNPTTIICVVAEVIVTRCRTALSVPHWPAVWLNWSTSFSSLQLGNEVCVCFITHTGTLTNSRRRGGQLQLQRFRPQFTHHPKHQVAVTFLSFCQRGPMHQLAITFQSFC